MDEDAVQRDLLSKVPPYWQHHRHESYASANNVQPSRIILEDRTEHPAEFAAQLWATGVLVDSYVVVSGKLPSIGDYVVWNCKIATIDVSDFVRFLNSNLPGKSCSSILRTESYARAGLLLSGRGGLLLSLFPMHACMLMAIRYSEFEDLRRKLLATYPSSEGAMPSLPPKSVVRKQCPPISISASYHVDPA